MVQPDAQMQRPFVLLDRDGTIIQERHYLADPSDVQFIPGALEGLCQLMESGLGLLVITNQSGVGRGYFDTAALDRVHERMLAMLSSNDIRIDGIYHCPHTPEDRCACRKPKPGMVIRAAVEHGFDPKQSYVIGDKACDIDLGRCVGATSVLVRTGYGKQVVAGQDTHPDYVAGDLREAADMIARLVRAAGLRVGQSGDADADAGEVVCS